MDEAAAVYRSRAAQCLALALQAQDEAQRTAAVQMAMYWFRLTESTNGGKAPAALLVRLDRQATSGPVLPAKPRPLRVVERAGSVTASSA
jgi:hypothetical protein